MQAKKEGKDLNSVQGQVPQKYMSPETSGETFFEVREGVNEFLLDMKIRAPKCQANGGARVRPRSPHARTFARGGSQSTSVQPADGRKRTRRD